MSNENTQKNVVSKSTENNTKTSTKKQISNLITNSPKIKWSLEKCMKIAKRYNSEEEWKQYAPSSYKSASANNWKDQCLNVINNKEKYQKQTVKREPVFLNAIILDVLARFSQKINTKNINIETSFAADFTIDSDNYLISIIISNLVSNALKYSKQNGKISITLAKEHNQITCTIQDHGIGISAEELNKIENRFYRSQSVLQTNIKGTGLGLSIVKRLTNLLKIEFRIKSDLAVGTIVELRFP